MDLMVMLETLKLNVHWKILNEPVVKAFSLKLCKIKNRIYVEKNNEFILSFTDFCLWWLRPNT